MTGRRALIGICMLCALVSSAFAAQSASAATKGTTVFTCKMVTKAAGTAGFSREHCKAEDAVSTEATFEHFEVEQSVKTHITGTNEKNGPGTETTVPVRLKSTQVGIEMEMSATGVHLEGFATNSLSGKEHIIEASGQIHFTGVQVTKPAGKGCVVKNETLTTNPLVFTSAGQGMALKIAPETGETFFEFEIEKCSIAELNGKYSESGSLRSTSIDGATINFTHADTTTQNTFKLRGVKAGIEGTITISGSKEVAEPTVPLSPTTVETE